MRKIITMTLVLFGFYAAGQGAMGDVLGQVQDSETSEKLYWAAVTIESNGTKYQARTDEEGKFRISGIPAGTYLLYIIHEEDTLKNVPVNVPMDGYDNLGLIKFNKSEDLSIGPVYVSSDRVRLKYGSLPVPEMTAKEIAKSPLKFDMAGLITSMSSEVRQNDDGDLVIRGARAGDLIYVMDGVKSNTISGIPSVAIGRVKVYTGGLPAKYGDTLGGAIVMETKSYFDLYRQYEARQLMNN